MQLIIAYKEMGGASLFCGDCLKRHLIFVKKCGVFDPISVPIPANQPLTGYIRAMAGIRDSNVDEIMAGCEEEIDSLGMHLVRSYILKAYMDAVVIHKPANFLCNSPNRNRITLTLRMLPSLL